MNAALIFVLFIAVAIGFALGVSQRKQVPLSQYIKNFLPSSFSARSTQLYLRGLNQLLSEQQDKAVDTFLSALEVNNDTVETHFALGAVLRRRGQLERAIRIHQNILDADSLRLSCKPKAHLELALDYDASGLLDRAELLLLDLVKTDAGATKTQALKYLAQIYEKEGEWQKALDTADALSQNMPPAQNAHWRYLQAHYCCEMAVEAITIEDKHKWVHSAKAIYPDHPRAILMEAQFHIEEGAYGPAQQKIQLLLSVRKYLHVGVPWLLRCYQRQQTKDIAGQQLVELFQQHGEPALVPLITRHLLDQGEGESMVKFVIGALAQEDALPHFSSLLQLAEPANINGEDLQKLLEQCLPFRFHCEHCGFEGVEWYWCCPACQSWM